MVRGLCLILILVGLGVEVDMHLLITCGLPTWYLSLYYHDASRFVAAGSNS